jgi:hypothetical protein
VRSHFLHMTLYATIVSCFFALMTRHGLRARLKLGLLLWLGMVGGALVLSWLMFPFPG